MLPTLDWPQVVAFISAFAISAGTVYQVILKIWAPKGDESMERREGKADVLADATMILTEQVQGLRRDMDEVKSRVNKLIDEVISGLRKDP